MPAKSSKDRASLCTFTYSDGRHCRMPRHAKNSHFCLPHDRKMRHLREADQTAREFCEPLTGDIIAPSSLNFSIARLFTAVAEGRIPPKTASTLANLAKILVKTIPLANIEYRYAFRSRVDWDAHVRSIYGYDDDDKSSPCSDDDDSSSRCSSEDDNLDPTSE